MNKVGDRVKILISDRNDWYKEGDTGIISRRFLESRENPVAYFYDVYLENSKFHTLFGFTPDQLEFIESLPVEEVEAGGYDRKRRWFPMPKDLLETGTKILYAVYNPTIKEEYKIYESEITGNNSMNNAGFNYRINPDPFIPTGEGETYRGGHGGGYKHNSEINNTRISDYNYKISHATLISTNLNKEEVMKQLKDDVKNHINKQIIKIKEGYGV